MISEAASNKEYRLYRVSLENSLNKAVAAITITNSRDGLYPLFEDYVSQRDPTPEGIKIFKLFDKFL